MKALRFCAVLLLPLLLCIACKNDLVSATTLNYNDKKNAADYEDFILPPESVTASQGKKKSVLLTWKPVKNAVQYQIYSADTPFSVFSKISETKEAENEITIDEEAGITKYYCVCAVNYFGTVSAKSVVARGATLAVPVITSIESLEEGNSVNVSWWMDNCSAATYADLVSFDVNVYALSAPSIKSQTITMDGNCRQLTVNGLTPKTEYYFEVEVINKTTLEKESSGKTSAETARKVIPEKPLAFNASQGDYTDKISLTWNLPEGCWYRENSGVSGFVLHPVYFVIYRKLAGEDDEKYRSVARVFVAANDEWKYRKVLGAGEGLYEITAADSDKKLAAPYESYVPEAEVCWEDTTAARGQKYSYYIQSVTDDTPEGKTITSDASKTEAAEGWLLSIPVFSINYSFEKSEDETKFEKINCGFNASFEAYGKTYKYFVVREQFAIDDSTVAVDAGKKEWSFNSVEEINSFVDSFEAPEEQTGYYTYALYVCPEGSNDISFAAQSVAASGKYLVTDDVNAVPVIEDFKLRDGFNNHFELSWKYNPEYVYVLHWKDVVDGVNSDEQTLEISSEVFEGKDKDDEIVFEHPAESGDRRIYLLEATTGLSESFRPNNDAADKIYETLGTAAPVIDSYEYDKLCVSWPQVQKAGADYVVSAKYEGEDTELVTDENINIEEQTEGSAKIYSCVISKPLGYDDALKSGKNIKLKVTAKSEDSEINTDNTTSSEIDVCTVGPAMTSVSVGEQKKSDRIYVKWSPVTGAGGYIIRRITYKTASANPAAVPASDIDNSNTDCYFFDGTNIYIDGSEVSSARASVELINGQYKLSDIDAVQNDSLSSYEKNQSCIKWGIPYGYIVIPVKQNGQKSDFNFTGKDIKLSETEAYTNLATAEKFGATEGYGLAVHAQKCESSGIQKIEWNVPYGQESSPTVYYRAAGSEYNLWQKASVKSSDFGVVSAGKQTASFKPESLTGAYEYLVAYNVTSANLSGVVPASFINDETIGLSAKDTVYTYSDDVQKEKSNKGYLLAVDYSADTGSGFSEEISWDEWNYEDRSLGPTSAYIRIKNYNISSEWKRVAKLGPDLHFVSAESAENTTVTGTTGAILFTIEPTVLMDGTLANPVTKGYMQVLRDAKHYYSIEFVRGDDSYEYGTDGDVYAYRNISEKELVKCALLNLAYAFYLDGGGNRDLSNVNNQLKYKQFNGSGYTGLSDKSWTWLLDYYTANIKMYDFSVSQLNPGETQTSIIKTSFEKTPVKMKGTTEFYLIQFNSDLTLNVDKNLTDLPDCYSGTLVVTSEGTDKLVVKKDGKTIVDINDNNLRRIYFPAQISSDDDKDEKKCWIKDPTYGWWPQ